MRETGGKRGSGLQDDVLQDGNRQAAGGRVENISEMVLSRMLPSQVRRRAVF